MRLTRIGIVNYGGGNIFSLKSALDRINIPHAMVSDVLELEKFSHIIIPGVGHAGKCMSKLQENKMDQAIHRLQVPVLGICVGMQLLTSYSEEGNSSLTNILPLKTKHFSENQNLKIPHMGWNIVNCKKNTLFTGIEPYTYFYFVHSYFVEYNSQFTIANATHGEKFSAAIQSNNFYGVQFHPEKSGKAGEQLLLNFSKI